MIHLPSRFAWSHVSYTDPDVSLVQSDEDQIIGQNPPAEHDPEGEPLSTLLLGLRLKYKAED